jgi:hypothetical protein
MKNEKEYSDGSKIFEAAAAALWRYTFYNE